MEAIKNLNELFNSVDKLKVPSYQRAYAWEEEQLNQFVSDMLEMKNKGNYYYGHFILEKTHEGFEIIDGQQRLTTFILFLTVCRLFKNEGSEDYIDKFETVDYDKEAFATIQKTLSDTNTEWMIEDFEITSELTLSIQRIMFALNHFKRLFKDGKSKLKLNTTEIDNYIKTFTQAHISTHITYSKAISVQIFELQNTRGVKLNLIEKVKSKLMKTIYLNTELEKAEHIIKHIQQIFAYIYRLEETASTRAFRGELTLQDILFHHLRMVDDGAKLSAINKQTFNSPSKHGDREEAILSYLDEQIKTKLSQDIITYITNLTENFKKSVELVSEKLPMMDKQNHLIGDVLILDKSLSLEFFILLYHKEFQKSIENTDVVKLWEKFLYTRDFHDKYYRQVYRDDFERMYNDLVSIKESSELKNILSRYINDGFRKDKMENESLPETVEKYIKNNESKILNNAFHWWQEKMVYLLYKYEIEQKSDLTKLRKIMKEGRSIEHILPQEWNWINETNNISPSEKNTKDEIGNIINGIGNLLLITASENSSKSNNHPMDKIYESCSGGSYEFHNSNRENWNDHTKWITMINDRGSNILSFLKEFVN